MKNPERVIRFCFLKNNKFLLLGTLQSSLLQTDPALSPHQKKESYVALTGKGLGTTALRHRAETISAEQKPSQLAQKSYYLVQGGPRLRI